MSSDHTGIEWTDATWNPVRGCSRVSEGCRNCYAERVAARFSGEKLPFNGLVNAHGRWNGTVRLVGAALTKPLSWRNPRRIFVNSMSDLFHESLTNEEIARVFGVMAKTRWHTFQVLTKRAERMAQWFEWAAGGRHVWPAAQDFQMPMWVLREGLGADASWPLRNVWIGVSVENQAAADERIPHLLRCPAAVRFLSCEPLLGPVDLRFVAPRDDWHIDALDTPDPSCRVHWVIAGGESGPDARPMDPTWAASLRDQCADAGVAFFMKQMARKAPIPSELLVRQFPEVSP